MIRLPLNKFLSDEILLYISIFRWYNTNVIRPWRSWISQQIPILKAGGSNPSGRAKKVA